MRKSRLTEEQMVAILRAADRTSVAEAAHCLGSAASTAGGQRQLPVGL